MRISEVLRTLRISHEHPVHDAMTPSGLHREGAVATVHCGDCYERATGREALPSARICAGSTTYRRARARCCSVAPAAAGPSKSRQQREPLVRRLDTEEVTAYQRAERLQQQLEVRCRGSRENPNKAVLLAVTEAISRPSTLMPL